MILNTKILYIDIVIVNIVIMNDQMGNSQRNGIYKKRSQTEIPRT